MRVEISERAKKDLRNIAMYIAADNPTRAMSFYEELHSACNELGEYPKKYHAVRQNDEYEIRKKTHGRYIIYYELGEKTVFILRIVHGAMDQSEITGLR